MKVVSKRNIVLILTIVAVIFILVIVIIKENITEEKEIMQEEKNIVTNNSALTMMYETSLGSGEYEVVSNTTWPQEGYVFNEELSRCENGGTLSWNDETNKVIMESNTSDKCYVYFDIYEPLTLAEYITTEVYTSDGVNGLYYHDGIGSYTNASEEAGDNSYRYSGANPYNYVCFGSDVSPCPQDNLYRIIGVFDGEVKLIKHDYANSDLLGTNGDYYGDYGSLGSYYKGSLSAVDGYFWNVNRTNTWSESQLNTVNLNTNYLNSIGSKWSDLIATHTWQVGGATSANVYSSPVQTAYNYEVGANRANTTYQAKVGLMYVSDYGYAASPDNWNTTLSNYNNDTNRNNNWMFMGLVEWTISRNSVGTLGSFYVSDFVESNVVYVRYAVRPSFYLESSVVLEGGSGSSADPYRI